MRESEKERLGDLEATVLATREHSRVTSYNIPSSVMMKAIPAAGRAHKKILSAQQNKHILIFNAESDNLMRKNETLQN